VELNPTWSVLQDLYMDYSLDLSGLIARVLQPRPQWALNSRIETLRGQIECGISGTYGTKMRGSSCYKT
jgi:hypothetical protein